MQSKEIERSLPDSLMLWDFFNRLSSASASALLLDYDGTLAPFHIDRNRAYPYPEAALLIEKIVERKKTRVVVISGRPVAELKDLLNPLHNLEMWGAHGLERVKPDGTYEQARVPWHTLELLSQAKEWVIESKLIPLAEIKPGGIAIHWRGLPEAKANQIEDRLLEGWTSLANNSDLRLLRFESGIELRVAHPDKGDAVNSILKESAPDTSIAYLGDDLTDEDSFRALSGRGLTVLVRPEHRQTAAQVWLKPPHELIEFLKQWLNRIS